MSGWLFKYLLDYGDGFVFWEDGFLIFVDLCYVLCVMMFFVFCEVF